MANARIRSASLENLCRVEVLDYRDVQEDGSFVSVRAILPEQFRRRRTTPGQRALKAHLLVLQQRPDVGMHQRGTSPLAVDDFVTVRASTFNTDQRVFGQVPAPAF